MLLLLALGLALAAFVVVPLLALLLEPRIRALASAVIVRFLRLLLPRILALVTLRRFNTDGIPCTCLFKPRLKCPTHGRRARVIKAASPRAALARTLAPIALVAPFLLVLSLAASARADGPPPPPTAATSAQAVQAQGAPPLAQVAAADQMIHEIAQNLGVPTQAALPPTFWQTTAGKVLQWTFYGLGVLSGLTLTAISLYETLH